jgi:ubiquinone biosynthesis protein
MTLYELFKDHQHRKRIKEIVHVFFEEEFGYLISKIKLHYHLPFHKRIQARIFKEKLTEPAIRTRQAFEKLGPTFVKFGQLLSLRPDLVPPEFIGEFEKMQDKVPTFPFSIAKKIIETRLKKPLNEIFSSFDQKPIASASIAQVYKAKIGKQTVAVKVQRPNIREIMENDIGIMYKIADLLEDHIPELKDYGLKEVVHEFEKWTLKELNFNIEAMYARKIADNFKGSKVLKVPKIYDDLTDSQVLVMEFLDGIPLHDIEKLKKKKIDLKKVIRNCYFIALKQVFIDGFFHADPHPGNILVLNDGKIGLIDFGILGHFDKQLKRNALDLLRAFVDNNTDKVIKILLKMNPQGDLDEKAFHADVRDIFEQIKSTAIDDLRIGSLIKETLTKAYEHHIKIPPDFVLYGKTLAIVEGIALRYNPGFNFTKETKSTLTQLLDYKFFAREIADRTKVKVDQYAELMEAFPETAKEILEKVKRFKLGIDIDDDDLKRFTLEMERSSGNIALGFIIAALIVGSAMIMQVNRWSYVYTSGFVVAGLLGLWLVHRTVLVKIWKKMGFTKKEVRR